MTRDPTHASLRLAFGATGLAAIGLTGLIGRFATAEERHDGASEESKKNGKFFHGPIFSGKRS
jgi:hypothetical protein